MPGQIKKQGYNQADLVDFLRRLRNHGHFLAAAPGLAPATVAPDIKSTALAIIVDGVGFSKAAADPLVDLPGAFALTNTAANQSNIVLIQMGPTGTITLKQGPIVAGTASDTIKTLPLPVPDLGVCVIGYIMIVNAAFTWGTTNMTAGLLFDGDPYLLPGVTPYAGVTVGLES